MVLNLLIEFVKSIFGKTKVPQLDKSQKISKSTEIDWSNPKEKISKYFNVREATFLPSWNAFHIPSEEEKKEIVKLAKKMDIIRELVGKAIVVHVWIRPKVANIPNHKRDKQDYNLFIGSTSKKSAHIFGKAVDFHVSGQVSKNQNANMRKKIKPLLKELDIRMENIDGKWIHLDTNPVGYKRFFKP